MRRRRISFRGLVLPRPSCDKLQLQSWLRNRCQGVRTIHLCRRCRLDPMWNSAGNRKSTDFALWRGMGTPDYVVVGGFFTRSHNKPTAEETRSIKAIHKPALRNTAPGSQIWTDKSGVLRRKELFGASRALVWCPLEHLCRSEGITIYPGSCMAFRSLE